MKRLLYIAFYFPPLGGVAAIRAVKHVKYLVQHGYDVQVLTVRSAFARYPKDHTLLTEIPGEVKVWRAFFPDPNWLFKLLYGLRLGSVVKFLRQRVLIPDPEKLWLPFARRKLDHVICKNPCPDFVLISSGPPSCLSLGLDLKRNHLLPYICDFRDEWTNNPERINLSYPAKSQHRELVLETQILAACSGVAYLTELMKDNFEQRLPFLKAKPNAVIPNGFDDSDFEGLAASGNHDKFHLVYSGSFYDRRQPDSLWESIVSLINCSSLPVDSIAVDIYGKNTVSFVLGKFADHEKIRRIVRFHPFQSHRESLRSLMRADALLLYLPSGKNAQSVLTGKIFDYLRSGKPVLAIVPPDGLAAKILTDAGTGFVADYQDREGIKTQLLRLWHLWHNQELDQIRPNREFTSQFSREKLASRLVALIGEVTA